MTEKMKGASRDHAPTTGAGSALPSFTPGPWRLRVEPRSLSNRRGRFLVRGAQGQRLGLVITGERPEHAANASLIAAAPDLYAALKALWESARLEAEGEGCDDFENEATPLWQAARAALSKALGPSDRTGAQHTPGTNQP